MKESQEFIRKLKAVKRETNFDLIKSIMAAMNSAEIRYSKNYLRMLHNSEFEGQALKLFRYILEAPTTTEQEARKDFAKENSKVNFDKTLTVLKKALGWSLVSEYNTQRDDSTFSYKWKTTFEVMHNIMLYYVVVSRQISGYAFDLLNETIEKAKEVEAYRELSDALELKIRHIKARSENRTITRLEKELKFYTECEKAVVEANRIYYDVGTITRKQGITESELINKYQEALATLTQFYSRTNSESILEHCLFVEASIYQIKKQHSDAGKVFQKLYDLTIFSPVLNGNRNIGKACAFIADNHIRQRNFEIALTFCKKAKNNFDDGSFNYFQMELLEYYVHFYTNKFYHAEKKVQGILNNPNYRESEFLINTKKYLVACALFAQTKYKEALSLLISLEKIWNDTTGWNVGVRVLIMLCYKMLGNDELMAVERNRFRSLFDKYRHRTTIRERDRIILKIIHEFLKPNSDFKSVYNRRSNLFKMLASKGNEWEILSHEMIVFEQWFISMMNKVPYELELNFVEDEK